MTKPPEAGDLPATDIERLRELMREATKGDLSTAETSGDTMIECPVCGDGDIEARDYCNIDHKALGVMFYGIGPEFGAHEKLWSAVMQDLPALLDELATLRSQAALSPAPSQGDVERVDFAAEGKAVNDAHWRETPAYIAMMGVKRGYAIGIDDLAWFSARPTLSLDHYSPWFRAPWFCDDDDLRVEWRVSQVSGPRDEREYDIVGRGETAADAIKAARTFFHQSAPRAALSDDDGKEGR